MPCSKRIVPAAPPPRHWVPAALTILTIGTVIGVTLWQLHPSLLITNTTTTGGDTGAHIALPQYLQSLLKHGHLSGWDPGWYDGFPLYTFYFALPDLFAAVGGWIIPYDVAFKFITILGSVTLPVCAWACGRLFRLPRPVPTVLAALTLPFLFDYTFTIYGGNLFSTLAGEYAFSFSLSLALLFLGLFATAVREGKYRIWASVVLACCVLSHIVPAMYALAGAVVLTVIELLPPAWGIGDSRLLALWRPVPADLLEQLPLRRRTLFRAGTTVGLGLLLSGWWLVPFGLNQSYATSMGYQNLRNFGSLLFPEADAWALVIAALAIPLAILVRSRFGAVITIIGAVSAVALVFDPQGSLYNVRLLPLWFISVYLMTAWGIGTACVAVVTWWRSLRSRRWAAVSQAAPWDQRFPRTAPGRDPWPLDLLRPIGALLTPSRAPAPRWAAASVGGALIGLFVAAAVVVPPFILPASSLPVTLGGQPGDQLVQLQLRGLREPDVVSRVPVRHRRPWSGCPNGTAAGGPCGSTARARTGSARPNP